MASTKLHLKLILTWLKLKKALGSCPYFSQRQIPCKHIFSIFKNFQWTWEDLPRSLTEGPLLILDNAFLKRTDKVSDYLSGSGIEEDTEAPPNDSDIEQDTDTTCLFYSGTSDGWISIIYFTETDKG